MCEFSSEQFVTSNASEVLTETGANPWWTYFILKFREVFPGGTLIKSLPANAGDTWIGKIPWKRKWQPTPVFLPGKSHGQRSLEGYSPQGHKSIRHNITIYYQQQQILNKINLRLDWTHPKTLSFRPFWFIFPCYYYP